MKNLIFSLFAIVLFSCGSVAQTEGRPSPVITVQSDFVGMAGEGCFIINVRVYLTSSDGGTVTLVSNSDVRVGACGRVAATNLNPNCKDEEYKGDFFMSIKGEYKECVVDLFREDEVLYAKYLIEKKRVIDEYLKNNR